MKHGIYLNGSLKRLFCQHLYQIYVNESIKLKQVQYISSTQNKNISTWFL